MKFKQIIYGLIAIFISSCTGYTKKDGKVYLRHSKILSKIGVDYLEVKNADYETFKVINNNLKIDLAWDKNYVFLNTSILELADPNTFEQVKEYYWKDKKNVYLLRFGSINARLIDADPKTFEVFNNYLWAKDKNHIYYGVNKLIDGKSKSFVPIDEDWGKDDNFYYYNDLTLYTLDYKSAKIVSPYYIKDKNSVYFRNTLVKEANPKTFKADGIGWFGHDDKYMFDWGENKGLITQQYKRTYIDKK
jgi:hypothetical protein